MLSSLQFTADTFSKATASGSLSIAPRLCQAHLAGGNFGCDSADASVDVWIV
jgi:hypothetical protein